ncbi:hypothetical protein WJX72_001155 [[Myrmecia] bisecta]|uniref:Transaldolase n=1 Tax=[Myrmecia] bisecta TaxID=41462 RepID=A0AAW1PPG6_9CHLO
MQSIESLVDTHKPTAATVTSSVLTGILANPTSQGLSQYKAAIERAMRYEKCSMLHGDERLACVLVAAMCSLGALISESVPGRISMELDPRLAYDTDGLVKRAKATCEQFQSMGVSTDRLLIRLPGTWEGIQAAKSLEQEGIATHVILVYSFVQAVAAAQAGCSVIQPNVGHIRDWFSKNPGAIRDPRGPRQDSGGLFQDTDNPAIKMVEKIYNYCKQQHPDVKIMAAGVRSKQEALELAGVDYIVLSPRVLDALSQTPTLQGYNDGLRVADEQEGVHTQLCPANAKEARFTPEETAPVTKQLFQEGLGQVGMELLDTGVQRLVDDITRLETSLREYAVGSE